MNEPEIYDLRQRNPPAFNLPVVILVLAGSLTLIHVYRTYLINPDTDFWLINVFAFVPIFYSVDPGRLVQPLSVYWSPITHGLLHGDWTHLFVNLIWLVAFGSAVARRFATPRFIAFLIIATASGALAHVIFHPDGNSPLIGASGAISACMGAAIRFAFGPAGVGGRGMNQPALSLVQSLSNRTIVVFLFIWFLLNWLFGTGILPLGIDAQIAWEAHMGGFLFGWLGFSLFDRKTAA